MKTRRSGIALIVILWISMLLTLGLYSLLLTARVQKGHANLFAAETATRQAALSGVEAATAALDADDKTVDALTDSWAKDDAKWREIKLGSGTYSLIRPAYADETEPLFGLGDEGGKININYAPKEILQKIPGMTEDIADCILDWRDEDPLPNPKGAESDYYLTLTPPYSAKNKPFDTLEELLYVKGVTKELFYGEDVNLNGILDGNENDGKKSPPDDNSDGKLQRGFYHYCTVWSYDLNQDKNGKKRLNLNKATREQLRDEPVSLNNNQLNQIEQFKRMGGQFASTGQLLDLPAFNKSVLGRIMDFITTVDSDNLPGVINIMTAPKEVLVAIPGLDDAKATALIEWRSQEGLTINSIGQAIVNLDNNTIKQLAPFVTIRSRQYRIDAVGVDGDYPVYKRVIAVYDRAPSKPKIVYMKDITDRGMPYAKKETVR